MRRQLRLVPGLAGHGLRVRLAAGWFDILHAGHVSLLRAARRRCDRLVVAPEHDVRVAPAEGPDPALVVWPTVPR